MNKTYNFLIDKSFGLLEYCVDIMNCLVYSICLSLDQNGYCNLRKDKKKPLEVKKDLKDGFLYCENLKTTYALGAIGFIFSPLILVIGVVLILLAKLALNILWSLIVTLILPISFLILIGVLIWLMFFRKIKVLSILKNFKTLSLWR